MNWTLFFSVFGTIFLAELGDKTQISTLIFSANTPAARWVVFAAAALALTATSAFGVLAGGWVSRVVGERLLNRMSGVVFIALGIWTIFKTMGKAP